MSRLLPDGISESDLTEYERGVIDGYSAFAYSSSQPWAENGVRYVGTTGTTLRQAIAEFLAESRA